jgi:SAM-dependent methyltransferase
MRKIGSPVPTPQEYYSNLLREHGPGPASVDVTREGQLQRFEILLKAFGDTTNCQFLDVGCGYGAFADFLYDNGRHSASYHGIDVCSEMIRAACDRFMARKPSERLDDLAFEVRDLLAAPLPRTYECVVASGLFQLHHGLWHAERLIRALWEHTEHILAFNMLSVHAPQPHTNGELYADPKRIWDICERLTPHVLLDHTYRRNDFTVVLHRGPDTVGQFSFPKVMEAAAA